MRIERQKEIDASIAARADTEDLYDKPYDDREVRVAGPFTVESLSPHCLLALDQNEVLGHLGTAGVQQAHKSDRIAFTSLEPWPGELICADGRSLRLVLCFFRRRSEPTGAQFRSLLGALRQPV